jgi:hypothetical protein
VEFVPQIPSALLTLSKNFHDAETKVRLDLGHNRDICKGNHECGSGAKDV